MIGNLGPFSPGYVVSTVPQAGQTDVQNQLYPYPGVGHTKNSTGRNIVLKY